MVWDRCNYSDNIREPALPAVLSPRLQNVRLQARECSYLLLSFTSSTSLFVCTHLFTLIFSSVSSFVYFLTSNELIHIFFSFLQEHMFIYSPLFSVVCKAEFVPVGWKSNEGKSCCYCAAVDCAPPPHPLYWLWAPNKTDAQFVCFQRFLHPSSFQEFLITAVFVWL